MTRPHQKPGTADRALRHWTVPLVPRPATMCRFALTTSGASVSVERGCGRLRRVLWQRQVRLMKPVSFEGDAASAVADLVVKAKLAESDLIHCFFLWGIQKQALAGPYFGPKGPRARVMHRRSAQAVQALTEVQNHLYAVMDKKAAAIAAKFPPDQVGLRFFVYQQLVNADGRLNQAARTCPGLFLLAFMMQRQGMREASHRIITALCRGQPIDSVITAAVELWAKRFLRPNDLATRRAQRIRVCRAGPLVAPFDLWYPTITRVTAQEIPTRSRENARWFSMMTTITNQFASAPHLSAKERSALLAFGQRNVMAVVALVDRTPEVAYDRAKGVVALLVAYAAETKDVPLPRTSFARFLAKATRWLAQDRSRRQALVHDVAADHGTGLVLP